MTVAVSGGFDPVHVGHVELFKQAKKLGTRLVVILNNDNWLMAKKGYVFMPVQERFEIIKSIRYVDDVIISGHPKNPKDMSVSRELEQLRPDIFGNGGDRNEIDAANPQSSLYRDIETCQRLGIKMVFNLGKKIQSSSDLVKKVTRKASS